jgi:hypothetical protein
MRPEWLTCIRKNKNFSLCGRVITFGFAFENLEHAEAEVAREGRLVPCKKCMKVAEIDAEMVK